MSRDDIELFIGKLSDREDWLTREISGGGSWEHLNARRQECAYIREQLAKLNQKAESPKNSGV